MAYEAVKRYVVFTVVLFPVIAVFAVIANAIALTILWGWFVAETFGIPQITYFEAAGLTIVVGMFNRGYFHGEKLMDKAKFKEEIRQLKESGASEESIKAHFKKAFAPIFNRIFAIVFFAPLFAVIFGWIIHSMM